MCVQTSDQAWERPAQEEDCAILAEHFAGIDFADLLAAMSADGAQPLTTDLVLVGAMMHTQPDDGGMRYVPFSVLEPAPSRNIIKLPIMDKVVEWFENTALGADMWKNASDWCERQTGARVHFAMNCGCGLVATTGYNNGQWTSWKQRFNARRAHLFGRTTVLRRETNSLEGLDLSPAQFLMWTRIRHALDALAKAPATRQAQIA